MNKDLNSGTYSGTEVVHLTRRSCIKCSVAWSITWKSGLQASPGRKLETQVERGRRCKIWLKFSTFLKIKYFSFRSPKQLFRVSKCSHIIRLHFYCKQKIVRWMVLKLFKKPWRGVFLVDYARLTLAKFTSEWNPNIPMKYEIKLDSKYEFISDRNLHKV